MTRLSGDEQRHARRWLHTFRETTVKAWRGDGSPVRDDINVLDCVFGDGWFPTFEALARHMREHHQNPVTVPRQYRTRQNTREALRKDRPVAKKTKAAPRERSGGRLPEPTRESMNRAPFLKPNVIGRKVGARATLKIDGKSARVVDGNYGDQLIVDASIGGKSYAWGVTIDSVNYRILFDRFGANPKLWKGNVKVFLKEAQSGRPYIAVESY